MQLYGQFPIYWYDSVCLRKGGKGRCVMIKDISGSTLVVMTVGSILGKLVGSQFGW